MLETRRGRFCESGVDEATYESNSRPGLMFYELNSWDMLGNSPWKRSTGEELEGTFMGDMNILAQIQLIVDPDAKFTTEGHKASSAETAVNAKVASDSDMVSAKGFMDLLVADG